MRIILFLILLLSSLTNNSQTIKGKITENNKEVAFANVLVKNVENSNEIIAYQVTNEKGEYSIVLKKKYESFIVEVNYFLYESQQKIVTQLPNINDVFTINFELVPKINSLKEVVINNDNPIIKKKDTTTYNIEKFKDGTERVVEDILKKLPGIKVEENGEIKFYGKSIKKMLLDGDDLFDKQYAIGSRNINIEMLDKVEAIENFNENALLKGLKDNEEVAINLKLKKSKSDLSGNCDLGIGYKDKNNSSIVAILINSRIKSFGLITHNNIGINNTPYDFQSQIKSLEGISDKNLTAFELLNQGNTNRGINNRYSRINNSFFTNGNLLFKLSKKIILKTSLSHFGDKLKTTLSEETSSTLNNDNFSFIQIEDFVKTPKLFNSNFHLINNSRNNFNWEYIGKLSHEKTNFNNDSKNNFLEQKNNIYTSSFFTKHNLNLTKRINNNSAILLYGLYAKSNSPQNYSLSPGLNVFELSNSQIINSNQISKFEKETLNTKTEFLKKIKDLRLSFKFGFNSIKNKFNSLLTLTNQFNETNTKSSYKNNLIYNVNYPFLDIGASILFEKFSFKLNLSSQYYRISFEDMVINNSIEFKKIILNPNVKIQYKIDRKNSLIVSYSLNKTTPEEQNIYTGIVQRNYREFQNNNIDVKFLENENYSLLFFHNDLFHLTKFSLNINYNINDTNYFSRSIITNNTSITNNFLLDIKNKDYNVNIEFEKYIGILKSTFNFNTNLSCAFDKNIINNSELRDIKNKMLSFDFTFRKKITSKINLDNKFSYATTIFKADELSNSFSGIKNTTKLKYNILDRLKFIPILNFIANDITINNNYWFLDSEITFTSKNKKIDYSIIGNNLTNIKTFNSINVSDYSRIAVSQNLLPRFMLASVSFKF